MYFHCSMLGWLLLLAIGCGREEVLEPTRLYRVEDGVMLTGAGEQLGMRGINLAGAAKSTEDHLFDLSEEVIAGLIEDGVDSVRLLVFWNAVQPEGPDGIDADYVAGVARRVATLSEAGLHVVLRPSLVQGEGAAEDIAAGIAELNALGGLDLLIVGRGGGSVEDLAAFNSETVVRAVRASQIPVISAVGHEVDVSLADLAADVRAPTPSAAAELAVRDGVELRDRVTGLARRAYAALDRLIEENQDLLASYRDSYGLRRVEDRILQDMQRIDDLQKGLLNGVRVGYDSAASAYHGDTARLAALSPLSVLARGYSVTQTHPGGVLVQDAQSLSPGDELRVRFARGEVTAAVDQILAEGAPSTDD